MQALREEEHTNLEPPEAKPWSRAAFGRSRALESTATGTMLRVQRSRFFASGSRTARPLLRREQEPRFGEHRHRHNAQCAKKPLLRLREPDSAAAAETRRAKLPITGILHAALKHIKEERVEKHPENMQALREAEHANLELPEAKRRSQAAFGRSRTLDSTATGTMLSARRSLFFASGSQTARPLLRREERSRL
ncbi:unnamed protein product [Coccothraustes coccothraustes]